MPAPSGTVPRTIESASTDHHASAVSEPVHRLSISDEPVHNKPQDVHIAMTEDRFARLVDTLRPPTSGLGNPGPLGLGAFALTTFVLSTFNAGLLDKSLEGVVLPLALWYGGIAQILAGMWEFKINNTFGATAFTSYGAFWLSFATYVFIIVPQFVAKGMSAQQINDATGIYLFGWTVFTFYMFLASLRISYALIAVFALLTPAFIFLTLGAFTGVVALTKIGGWFGLLCAGAAWYASFGVVFNQSWGRAIIPIGVIRPAKDIRV